jgi:cytochrome c biogenesis protein CcdA
MLSSITPLGERGRHNRFGTTATAFVIGAVAGGTTLGALCGWLGSFLPERSSAVDALAVVALAVAGAVLDVSHVPTIKRQVNEDWLHRYRGWVYGVGFGAQLGFGVVTVVTSAATYVAFALAVLTGSVAGGAAIGFTFGAIRGLSLLLARNIESPDELRRFHRQLDARAAGGARLGVVAQVLIGVFAVIALGGYV